MITPPKVSVVCSIFNRSGYILESINSILSQDLVDFEFILVNDGSDDPKVNYILDSIADARIRVVNQNNAGFTAAISRAITESRSDFVAIHGSGDISYSSRLRKQYKYMIDNPSVGVVGSWGLISKVGTEDSPVTYCPKRLQYKHRHFLKSNPLIHGSAMFRKSVYNGVGGYRKVFKYAQDRDLWCRISMNHSIHIYNEILYECRQFPKDGVSTSIDKTLEQAFFSDFAVQLSRTKMTLNFDHIDAYDDQAYLFWSPSKRYYTTMFYAWCVSKYNNQAQKSHVLMLSMRRGNLILYIVALLLDFSFSNYFLYSILQGIKLEPVLKLKLSRFIN